MNTITIKVLPKKYRFGTWLLSKQTLARADAIGSLARAVDAHNKENKKYSSHKMLSQDSIKKEEFLHFFKVNGMASNSIWVQVFEDAWTQYTAWLEHEMSSKNLDISNCKVINEINHKLF